MGTQLHQAALLGLAILNSPISTAHADKNLTGVLMLEENEPLELARIVRYDFESGRMAQEAAGDEGSATQGQIAFLGRCDGRNIDYRVTLMDEDGLIREIGPCFEQSSLSGFGDVTIASDTSKFAFYDSDVHVPARKGQFTGSSTSGVRVMSDAGEDLGFVEGYQSPAWAPDGTL